MDGWMDGSARPGVTAIRVAKHTQVTNHFISPALSKQSIAYVSFDVGRDHITDTNLQKRNDPRGLYRDLAFSLSVA